MGLRDAGPQDGILDIMQTDPDTEILTVLPDTLDGSQNVPVLGRAWDGRDGDGDGEPVPPGVYFLRTELGYARDLSKVVIIR